MTTSEKATLQTLIAETVMAESGLSGAQNQLIASMKARDAANKRLSDFLDGVRVSDAPHEPPVKRAYNRKPKPSNNCLHCHGVDPETCGRCRGTGTEPNAALSGATGETN